MGQSESAGYARDVNVDQAKSPRSPTNGHHKKKKKEIDDGPPPPDRIILGKYSMDMSKDGLMGEGSFSACRRGKCTETGEEVAVKFYKIKKVDHMQLVRFRRQIEVLNDLATPFVQPSDPRLWTPLLNKAIPARLFMRLIDYSKDAKGEPGVDATDGALEVINELASYSLLDFLQITKRESRTLSKSTVKSITQALLLVVAGLHAKGMVHLDLKPENFMVFSGSLKLIDVEGCISIGSVVTTDDPTVSFSPWYCAPEWAKFLVEPGNSPGITAMAALDVWSVGCTVCELVTLDAMMAPVFANLLRRAHSQREASFLFFDWLRNLKSSPIPKSIQPFDPALAALIHNSLLVSSAKERKTCAECLTDDWYFRNEDGFKSARDKDNPLYHEADEEIDVHELHGPLEMPEEHERAFRHRLEDHSHVAMHQGPLWKLNHGKDLKEANEWLERDMWIANNGSLCYFSKKEGKRLVLLDAHHMFNAEITPIDSNCARPFGIKLQTTHIEAPDDQNEAYHFAASSEEDRKEWIRFLGVATRQEAIPTMKLGESVANALHHFKLTVKNRRQHLDKGNRKEYRPAFKGWLWKVKADGNPMIESHWFKREMWLAHNGSLVYWSPKDETELVYYTSADIHRATLEKVNNEDSLKPWAFTVQLPPCGDLEFSPGEFAAESEAMRAIWMQEFAKAKAGRYGEMYDDDCFSFLHCCTHHPHA